MDHIPAIHNYYSDLLVSLANYFDNVLGEDYIQNYQFNIGSKTFQLNYKPQKALPSCIINYVSSQMSQYYDWFMHRVNIDNPFLIPIVYDSTKDLSLYIQEAQYEHVIEITFNCNSVMELLELQHKFEVYLPLNKYVEVFNYYTFLDIPQYFLNPLMFDTNRDTIYNLYTKRDTIKNELSQMASVKYDPMIRLDSLNPGSINSDNKSFSLIMSLTVLNPVPLYFQIPQDEIPNINKQINEIKIENICIPIYENVPIIKLSFHNLDKCLQEEYVPLLNIIENNFKTDFIHNDRKYRLTGHIDSKFEQYSATIESDNYTYPVTLKLYKSHLHFNIEVTGVLNGHIIDPIWEPGSDEITGFFQGEFNTNNLSIRKNIFEKVTLTLDKPTKIVKYHLFNLRLRDVSSNKFVKILDHSTIPYGKLTLFHHDFNDSRLNIDFEKSLITKLGIYDVSDQNIKYLNSISEINKYGNINISLENIINDVKEYFTISGCINQYTWKTSFNQIFEQESANSQALFLIMDGVFNNAPKYGASYIDHISLDMAMGYAPSPVYLTDHARYFHDFTFGKLEDSKIIYSVAIPNMIDYVRLDCDYAYINLMPFDYIKLCPNIERYNWSLFFKDYTYTKLNSNFILEECFIPPFYYGLVLKIPIKDYTLKFGKYKKFNDIFYFKLYAGGSC